MASLKDVAKLANVSLMTVSRALNTPERLKPETLARVQAAIAETNYVPDLSAKKIRGARATPAPSACWRWIPSPRPFRWRSPSRSKRRPAPTAGTALWSICFLTIVRKRWSTCSSPTVRTALSLPPWACAGTAAGETADSALRAGQLRKPQPAGGQLYPGR